MEQKFRGFLHRASFKAFEKGLRKDYFLQFLVPTKADGEVLKNMYCFLRQSMEKSSAMCLPKRKEQSTRMP
jgi:hypothetical protein